MIKQRVEELKIEDDRIMSFFKISQETIDNTYECATIETDVLLKWSKLLEYDFFRIYSQHLILYAPPASTNKNAIAIKSTLPSFRKNLYTHEIIEFILNQISSGEMTKTQVIERYRIPKTTLYKWISKYSTTLKH